MMTGPGNKVTLMEEPFRKGCSNRRVTEYEFAGVASRREENKVKLGQEI